MSVAELTGKARQPACRPGRRCATRPPLPCFRLPLPLYYEDHGVALAQRRDMTKMRDGAVVVDHG